MIRGSPKGAPPQPPGPQRHLRRRPVSGRGLTERLSTAMKELICMKGTIQQNLIELTGKPVADCTDQELYLALLTLVRRESEARRKPVSGKKLYYISAEFLIGKLLSNNLIN